MSLPPCSYTTSASLSPVVVIQVLNLVANNSNCFTLDYTWYTIQQCLLVPSSSSVSTTTVEADLPYFPYHITTYVPVHSYVLCADITASVSVSVADAELRSNTFASDELNACNSLVVLRNEILSLLLLLSVLLSLPVSLDVTHRCGEFL